MDEKNDKDKAACSFASLDKEAQSAYFVKYIVGGSLTAEGQDCTTVFKWLVDHYAKTKAGDELIRMYMHARLDKYIKALSFVQDIFVTPWFNDKAKCGMLRIVTAEHAHPAEVPIFKEPN